MGRRRATATILPTVDGLSSTFAARKAALRVREMVRPTKANAVMGTPPTVGALATSSAIGGGLTIPAGPVIAVANAVPNMTAFTWYAGKVEQLGTVNPDYNYMKAKYLTDPYTSAGGAGAVEFLFDGTTLEVLFKGVTNTVWVAVDDEYVADTAVTVGNTGSTYYLPLTFASRAPRRIRVEWMSTTNFGGVVVGTNDTVQAVQKVGPRVMVCGDSFSEGGGGGYSTRPWWRTFGNVFGWPDVWSASLGSTGWLTAGPSGRPTIRGRLATDVYPYAPDVLILAAGINDTAWSQAQIEAEVAATIADIRANLPNCLVVIVGPFGKADVASTASTIWAIRDGAKAAAQAAGALWVDLLEQPINGAGALTSTTLASSASIGASSISTAAPIPRRTVIKIDSERVRVTTCAGSGPYTVSLASNLTAAHTSGATVTEVGPSLWTGTGKVGATTGSGNCDLIVGADGTHPTQAGSDLIGYTVAAQFARLIGA